MRRYIESYSTPEGRSSLHHYQKKKKKAHAICQTSLITSDSQRRHSCATTLPAEALCIQTPAHQWHPLPLLSASTTNNNSNKNGCVLVTHTTSDF
jgi:hypothetical protein